MVLTSTPAARLISAFSDISQEVVSAESGDILKQGGTWKVETKRSVTKWKLWDRELTMTFCNPLIWWECKQALWCSIFKAKWCILVTGCCQFILQKTFTQTSPSKSFQAGKILSFTSVPPQTGAVDDRALLFTLTCLFGGRMGGKPPVL